jgi:hypothetical protein
MVSRNMLRRIGATLSSCVLVLLLGSSYSYAADCTGPADPDPLCTPVASPAPSVSPDPVPSVSPSVVPSDAPVPATVVVLTDEQWAPLIWCGGALLCLSIIGVIGSWSR